MRERNRRAASATDHSGFCGGRERERLEKRRFAKVSYCSSPLGAGGNEENRQFLAEKNGTVDPETCPAKQSAAGRMGLLRNCNEDAYDLWVPCR